MLKILNFHKPMKLIHSDNTYTKKPFMSNVTGSKFLGLIDSNIHNVKIDRQSGTANLGNTITITSSSNIALTNNKHYKLTYLISENGQSTSRKEIQYGTIINNSITIEDKDIELTIQALGNTITITVIKQHFMNISIKEILMYDIPETEKTFKIKEDCCLLKALGEPTVYLQAAPDVDIYCNGAWINCDYRYPIITDKTIYTKHKFTNGTPYEIMESVSLNGTLLFTTSNYNADNYFGDLFYSKDGSGITAMGWSAGQTSGAYYNLGLVGSYNKAFLQQKDGKVYYSTDGITWTSTGLTERPYCLYYGGGKFVLCTYNSIYYSTGGTTSWNKSSQTVTSPQHIFYAHSYWLLSTSKGFYYSTNGSSWTQSSTLNCNHCYYGNGIYVLCTTTGIMYSRDLKSWTSTNVTSSANCAEYHNGLWMAATGKGAYYSTDGITWIQTNITDILTTIHYAEGVWVISRPDYHDHYMYVTPQYNKTFRKLEFSDWGSSATQILRLNNKLFILNEYYCKLTVSLDDGATFLPPIELPGEPVNIYYQNNIYLLALNYNSSSKPGGIYYSTDGITWTQANLTGTISGISHISYFKNKFIAIPRFSQKIRYSYDGINWVETNTQAYSYDKPLLTEDIILLPTQGAYSTDGITWTREYRNAFSIVYHIKDCYIGVYDYYNQVPGIFYSKDLVTWTEVTSVTVTGTYSGTVMNGTLYLPIGDNKIAYTSNGTSWYTRTISNPGGYSTYALSSIYTKEDKPLSEDSFVCYIVVKGATDSYSEGRYYTTNDFSSFRMIEYEELTDSYLTTSGTWAGYIRELPEVIQNYKEVK